MRVLLHLPHNPAPKNPGPHGGANPGQHHQCKDCHLCIQKCCHYGPLDSHFLVICKAGGVELLHIGVLNLWISQVGERRTINTANGEGGVGIKFDFPCTSAHIYIPV